jgi:fructokinase
MNREGLFTLKSPTPIAVGSGLVALDIIINGWESESPILSAGGSCGNVMTILAYLGWKAHPIARIGSDLAADVLIDDLSMFGVHIDFLQCEKSGHTPIVIETIPVGTSISRTHFFSFSCPHCGAPLPRHRPILKSSVQHVVSQLPQPSIFYFDRISRAAIEIAKTYSAKGAVIIFEPSNVKSGKLFQECIQVAHIVKYSHESIGNIPGSLGTKYPLLQIETLGSYGLRFRLNLGIDHGSNWEYLETYRVDDLKDEAGSGDWCTAGVIHVLGQEGIKRLKEASKEEVLEALSFGQALAALNCRFEGARGGMYSFNFAQMQSAIQAIMSGRKPYTTAQRKIPKVVESLLQSICVNCNNSYKPVDLHYVMTSTGKKRKKEFEGHNT